MNTDLKIYLEEIFQKKELIKTPIQWQSVSGGSINATYRASTKNKKYFVKINTTSTFSNGFFEEVEGLKFLAKHKAKTPNIIDFGIKNEYAFLILEWVDQGNKPSIFWQNFAEQLAELHKQKSDKFGLDIDNFMGELPQQNSFKNSFSEFFIENRLKTQVKLAFNNHLLTKNQLSNFERLYPKLATIFPIEKPTAVHGDLWSGNFIATTTQNAVLIDPAVYYGHREVDLAMSKLFGGFSAEFYATYNKIYPLEKGFENRYPIYNLYPLLIHLNLFGKSYLSEIDGIISQF